MNETAGTTRAGLPMPDLSATFPGPFPSNRHAEEAERQAVDWLTTFPLLGVPRAVTTLANITGHGTARTFPDADREGLILCVDLMLWLTAFDDRYGESAGAADPAGLVARVGEFVQVLSGTQPPGGTSVFGSALTDLSARLRARATPTQYLRLTGLLRDALFGIVWEAHHFTSPERVTVRDYCAMRPHTVFVRVVTAVGEILHGYELSQTERESKAVRDLETAVGNLAGWINDLASYARELARGGAAPLSLPTLLMREDGCGPAETFAEVARRCEAEAALARARITELTSPGGGACAIHARALESVVASYVWHIDHRRYRV